MAEAEGQVLQREEIYQRVWGYAMVHGDRSRRRLRAQAALQARARLAGWRYIHTHFGIGYRFAAEPVEEPVGEALVGAGAGCRSSIRAGVRTRAGKVGPDGSDRNKHIRNVAIILAIAVAVWKLPGGGTAAATISNIFSVLFLARLLLPRLPPVHGAPR